MNPHLSIGTTTDRINLLDENGILLKDWVPVEGGHDSNYVESSLGDYGQVISYRETDVDEKFVLTIKRSNQDDVIRMGQDLRRMLRTALNYWTDSWREDFVYIAARAAGETNTRYAIVKDGQIPKDNNPFAIPFALCAPVMNDFELFVTRGPWGDDIPDTGTKTELSAVETYDGRNLGNTDENQIRDPTTGEGAVYVANHWKTANLTDIYWYDDNLTAFSGNLMDEDPTAPFDLLPAVPAANDYVAFGIDTTIDDSGPFSSLVFDIATAITGVTAGRWEYWNGAWHAFAGSEIQDCTNEDGLMGGVAFDTLGVKSVNWIPQSDWVTTAVNGVTGYWVRYLIVTAAGATSPEQQNRLIYSISWPYTEIQSTEILGDIVAKAKIRLREQYEAGPAIDEISEIIMGLRSTARGVDFRSYLNCADEQEAPGITVAVVGVGAFANDVKTPTGRKVTATNPAAAAAVVNFNISDAYTPAYHGTFRCFIRCDVTTGGAGDVSLQVVSKFGGKSSATCQTDYIPILDLSNFAVVDMGRVQFIPPEQFRPDEPGTLTITIGVWGAGTIVDLFDLILIPVDEWAVHIHAGEGDNI